MEDRTLLIDLIKYLKVVRSLSKIVLIVILHLSCSSPTKDQLFEGPDVLKEFKQIFPFLEINSTWEIEFIYNDEDLVQFEASKEDSTLQFNFVKLTKIREEGFGFPLPTISYCYSIDLITYSWEDEQRDTHIYYNDKLDTLYHFYWEKGKSWMEDPIFIRGKYTYYYYYNRLTPGQVLFFEQNKDSLSRVMGEDLPELPELDLLKSN